MSVDVGQEGQIGNKSIDLCIKGRAIGIVRKGYLLPKKTETFHAVGREVITSLFFSKSRFCFQITQWGDIFSASIYCCHKRLRVAEDDFGFGHSLFHVSAWL